MRRYMMSAVALILAGSLNGVSAGRAETADALMVVGSTQLQVPYSFDHNRFALWSGANSYSWKIVSQASRPFIF
jgi:hypothetical protein